MDDNPATSYNDKLKIKPKMVGFAAALPTLHNPVYTFRRLNNAITIRSLSTIWTVCLSR